MCLMCHVFVVFGNNGNKVCPTLHKFNCFSSLIQDQGSAVHSNVILFYSRFGTACHDDCANTLYIYTDVPKMNYSRTI